MWVNLMVVMQEYQYAYTWEPVDHWSDPERHKQAGQRRNRGADTFNHVCHVNNVITSHLNIVANVLSSSYMTRQCVCVGPIFIKTNSKLHQVKTLYNAISNERFRVNGRLLRERNAN